MKVIDLAEYVVRRAIDKGTPITNLRLQKTLYYIQGYSLKFLDEAAFDEDIQNWHFGPAVSSVHFHYLSYGIYPLGKKATVFESPSGKEKQLFDKVIDTCLAHTARQLVQKSQDESPWKNTYMNEVISVESIKEYFDLHNPLQIDGKRIY